VNTIKIGDISEAKVLGRFLELGYTVLLPWSNGERYDMVIEREGKFLRIQVKTARCESDGSSICFNVSSTNGSTRQRTSYSKDQIDYFAAYCPENDKIYLVSIGNAGINKIRLRLKPTVNNQQENVRWAKDYEL
jgi:hypothetical protein